MSTATKEKKEVLIVDPKSYGIQEDKALTVQTAFTPMSIETESLSKVYQNIIEMEPSKEACQKARELRLKLVPVRTGIAKIHKTEKAFYLAAGKFVDAFKNKLTLPVEQMEAKLLEIEKYFENIELKKIAELAEKRKIELESFDSPYTPDDLGTMQQGQYDLILNGVKIAFKEAKAAAEKVEAERIEKERLDKIESKRMLEVAPFQKYLDKQVDFRTLEKDAYTQLLSDLKNQDVENEKKIAEQEAENLRLKKEAEAKEAEILAAKKKQEAKAAKEKAEADKRIAEQKAIADAAQAKINEANALAEKKKIEAQQAAEAELAKGDEQLFLDMIEAIKKISTDYEGRFKSAANKKKFEATKTLLERTIIHITK